MVTLVANSINVEVDPPDVTVTIVSGPFFTCQVQSTDVGTYQEVSLIVINHYNEGQVMQYIGQFEMFCFYCGLWD